MNHLAYRTNSNYNKSNLAKAEEVHQTNKSSSLITADMPRAIYLFYFLPAKLYIWKKSNIKNRNFRSFKLQYNF